eukprot:SAG22_NODE_1608_length_4006_cov_3.294599_2_plen_328_part_00
MLGVQEWLASMKALQLQLSSSQQQLLGPVEGGMVEGVATLETESEEAHRQEYDELKRAAAAEEAYAAMRIQSRQRGKAARRQTEARTLVPAPEPEPESQRGQDAASPRKRRAPPAKVVDYDYRADYSPNRGAEGDSEVGGGDELRAAAARRIQAVQRGKDSRRQLQAQQESARRIQAMQRGKTVRRRQQTAKQAEVEAAVDAAKARVATTRREQQEREQQSWSELEEASRHRREISDIEAADIEAGRRAAIERVAAVHHEAKTKRLPSAAKQRKGASRMPAKRKALESALLEDRAFQDEQPRLEEQRRRCAVPAGLQLAPLSLLNPL